MVTEGVVRKAVGVEGAQLLVDIIEGAWQDHLDEGRLRTRWTRASIVWDAMVSRADASLSPWDGVTRVVRLERPMYVLSDRVLLRFKKHSRELQTHNYPTPSQRALARQGYFAELAWPTVTCGYVLDTADAGIESLVIANNLEAWSIDLRDLAAGNLTPATSILDLDDYREDINLIPSIRPPLAEGPAQ